MAKVPDSRRIDTEASVITNGCQDTFADPLNQALSLVVIALTAIISVASSLWLTICIEPAATLFSECQTLLHGHHHL